MSQAIERGQRYRVGSGVVQVVDIAPGEVRCRYLGARGGLCRVRGVVTFTAAAMARFERVRAA